MFIEYGTTVFTKFEGFFGEKVECPICHKNYKQAYVRNSVWAHLSYIPLFPLKKKYFKMCPICGNGVELKRREAKAEMINKAETFQQDIKIYAKHNLINKPNGFFAVDDSYELWAKDMLTGEEICISSKITKTSISEEKKARGLKKIDIIEV